MRIPLIYKRIRNYIVGFFFSSLCFIGVIAFLVVKKDNVLSDFQNTKSIVTNKGITKIKATRGKIDAFYLEIKDLESKVVFSRPTQNYSDLINAIKVKDTVTVYFQKSNNNEFFKIFQLEKNKEVLINLDAYNRNNKIGGFLSLIGAIFILFYTIYQDKKYWRKNEK